eukprot:106908-Pelagomonas_calceolata.AAC.3
MVYRKGCANNSTSSTFQQAHGGPREGASVLLHHACPAWNEGNSKRIRLVALMLCNRVFHKQKVHSNGKLACTLMQEISPRCGTTHAGVCSKRRAAGGAAGRTG